MVYSRTGYTIVTNGQTLVIAAPTVGGTTATVYTTAACTAAHTFPQTITSDTTYYVHPDAPGRYLVSACQPDGTELWGQKVDCFAGDGVKTISPLPSIAQLGADTGTVSYFRGQSPSSYVESVPRQLAASATIFTSQAFRWSSFLADRTMTVQNVSVCTGSTAAGATPTLIRFGIYSVASDGALTLVASTTNDTSLLANTYTLNTKALTTPYTITGGSRYAVGGLVVTGATAPSVVTLLGYSASLTNLSPVLCGQINSLSDLPATVAAASLNPVGSSAILWFGLS